MCRVLERRCDSDNLENQSFAFLENTGSIDWPVSICFVVSRSESIIYICLKAFGFHKIFINMAVLWLLQRILSNQHFLLPSMMRWNGISDNSASRLSFMTDWRDTCTEKGDVDVRNIAVFSSRGPRRIRFSEDFCKKAFWSIGSTSTDISSENILQSLSFTRLCAMPMAWTCTVGVSPPYELLPPDPGSSRRRMSPGRQ